MAFKKAVKSESKLRLALAGPAGSGKTYTALTLATALADGQPVAVIDTEHGSATKYADLFSFDAMEMAAPFSPDRYIEAIREAEADGYAVLVIDSLTHAWDGAGGLLEIVEEIAKRKYQNNTFRAWAEGTPIQTRLIEAMLASRMHIITTMRTKSDYATEKDERTGKTTVQKLGTAVKQRDGVEYEFDIFARMTIDNEAIIEKSRCPALSGTIVRKPGKPMAETLRTWLSGVTPVGTTSSTLAAPAAPTAMASDQVEQPRDPWAEVRELATQLGLTDKERTDIFKRHKKQFEPIVAELRKRAKTQTEQEGEYTFTEAEPADLAALGTVTP